MRFYLGTHEPSWLYRAGVELFVSHRRLARLRKFLPRAIAPWALDSGGFTELSMFGEWRTTLPTYVSAVRRYHDEIGMMEWAAPMDWMCEPWIVAKSGLSVDEHQQRTVDNLLELRATAPDLPFVPVLQGFAVSDYWRCVEMYEAAGVDLRAEPTVGLGSVCRRQATGQITELVGELRRSGIRLHGFGMKIGAFQSDVPVFLASADSMAWSFAARRLKVRMEGCKHGKDGLGACCNCLVWALEWRKKAIAAIEQPKELSLFNQEFALA